MRKNELITSFITNIGLLLTGVATALSGFVIQIGYHMGHHGYIDEDSVVWGMNYWSWSNTHKTSIVVLSLLAIAHVVLHWKWYKTVVAKKLYGRNTTAVTLTVLFLITAVTGYFPWFIDLAGGEELARKGFIEIHDKVTLFLFVYFITHTAQKFKWFILSINKLKSFAEQRSASF